MIWADLEEMVSHFLKEDLIPMIFSRPFSNKKEVTIHLDSFHSVLEEIKEPIARVVEEDLEASLDLEVVRLVMEENKAQEEHILLHNFSKILEKDEKMTNKIIIKVIFNPSFDFNIKFFF